MTKRHYFQSLVIFLASTYFVWTVLDLSWIEALLLVLLAIICVMHTVDVMTDIERKRAIKKLRKDRP
jgi:Flp pilus assembly protein TadB